MQSFWGAPARSEGKTCPNGCANLTLRAAQQLGLLHEQLAMVDLGFPMRTPFLSSYAHLWPEEIVIYQLQD